jgi:uncharacterized protein YcbK (DUF882 family)
MRNPFYRPQWMIVLTSVVLAGMSVASGETVSAFFAEPCGYRMPWSNEFLRARNAHTGVAQHSLHMQAEAIDIRLPGIPTSELRDAALRLHRGGVGYYRRSNFVHVDVGRVRHW